MGSIKYIYLSIHLSMHVLIRKTLTEVSADVDVEVDGVVAIVHQVAAAHFDQRVEVVLLAVRIEHEAGNLDTDGHMDTDGGGRLQAVSE